jgi:hypothetical protein
LPAASALAAGLWLSAAIAVVVNPVNNRAANRANGRDLRTGISSGVKTEA